MKNMADQEWYFEELLLALTKCGKDFRKATLYIGTKTVVHATWRLKPSVRNRHEEIIVTFGAPNYEDKKIIKRALKESKSFPFFRLVKYPAKKK